MGSSRNRLDSFATTEITIIGLGLTITQLAQNTKLNMTLRTLSLVLLTGIITVQVTYQFGVGPTTLETPIFSLVGLNTAAVEFDQAYNLHAGDICKLELIRWRRNLYCSARSNRNQPTCTFLGRFMEHQFPYYIAPAGNGKPSTLFNFQNDNSSF
jgi:hypothetical protein